MRFWDSSALIPLLVEEPATRRMEELLASDPDIVAWWASELECVSAIARREHGGGIEGAAAEHGLERLALLLEPWQEIEPTDHVRRTARRLLRVHPLRTADALQLAAAVVAAEGHPASLELVTLDERLADAARREGFPLAAPG